MITDIVALFWVNNQLVDPQTTSTTVSSDQVAVGLVSVRISLRDFIFLADFLVFTFKN